MELMYSYSRIQALKDGEQIDLSLEYSSLCRKYYKHKVFMTRTIWDYIISLEDHQYLEDSIGDILFMSVYGTNRKFLDNSTVKFEVLLPIDNPKPWTLISQCGPQDIDDPKPCITILTKEEL